MTIKPVATDEDSAPSGVAVIADPAGMPQGVWPPGRRTVHPWLGLAGLLAAATLWSLGGPLIKLLSGAGGHVEPVSGWTVAFYRALLGGLAIAPLAWPHRRSLGRFHRGWLVAAGVTFSVMTLTYVLATMQTAAANAIILQYTSPVWVFLLAPVLLGERPRLSEGAVLLLAMAGVVVIFAGSGGAETPGLILALVSGLGYGGITLLLRRLRGVNALAITCLNCLASAVILGVPAAMQGSLALSFTQFVLIAILGTFQIALPYAIFAWALRHVEAPRAAIIMLLETIINPLLTWLIAGEPVPTATWMGGPLIVAGVVARMFIRQRAVVCNCVTGRS